MQLKLKDINDSIQNILKQLSIIFGPFFHVGISHFQLQCTNHFNVADTVELLRRGFFKLAVKLLYFTAREISTGLTVLFFVHLDPNFRGVFLPNFAAKVA